MVKLWPIQDDCPKNGKSVDMRTCCASKPCKFYGAKPWSEFGEVSCLHPEAKTASEETRKVRQEVFRETAGVGHILYCGAIR